MKRFPYGLFAHNAFSFCLSLDFAELVNDDYTSIVDRCLVDALNGRRKNVFRQLTGLV